MRQTLPSEVLQTPALAGAVTTVMASLRAYVEAIGYARRMYRAYLNLSAMSDAALESIGIGRADIAAVVTETHCARTGQCGAPAEFALPRSSSLKDRRRMPSRSFGRLPKHRDHRRM